MNTNDDEDHGGDGCDEFKLVKECLRIGAEKAKGDRTGRKIPTKC